MPCSTTQEKNRTMPVTDQTNTWAQKPILIVLAGRTFPGISETQGDFDEWIARGLGNAAAHTCIDARTAVLPNYAEISGVVISGSHSMVSDHEPWSETLAHWLKQGVDVDLPMLGICYGHQLLAYACGGVVANHPDGIEIGSQVISASTNAKADYLFSAMPETFPAQLVHSQSVLQLPQEAILLATGDHEPHQAYRIGKCAWGVQFHPEFSAQAMRGYIEQMNGVLLRQQRDPQALSAAVQNTPHAALLLRRFAAYIEQHAHGES